MATSEEQCRIAARLRSIAPGSSWPDVVATACEMDTDSMSNNFHEFTGELCDRLADLIDPDTCRMEYDPVHNDYVCSKCGEFFDTATYGARNSDDEYVEKGFKHCPNCGRKVVKE